MSSDIKAVWHGHATWSLEYGEWKILIDPFLDANPSAKSKAGGFRPTHLLISHGHADHIADAASIATRTTPQVYCNYEISQWLASQGVAKSVGMNLGGGCPTEFGRVTLVPALHSSSLPDGSYGGTAGGWLIEFHAGRSSPYRIYYAGDTALFSDMAQIARKGVDCLIVPIGDLFTMGPEESLEAIRLVRPKTVLPTHYNTWPPIAQDANAWAKSVASQTSAVPVVPEVDVPIALA